MRVSLGLSLLCPLVFAAKPLPPIVIVPGDVSSQIYAKIDKPEVVHPFCKHKQDWFRLWLSAKSAAPYYIDCWNDNARLVVDENGHATDSPGVEIRIGFQQFVDGIPTIVPGWGTTDSIEQIDPDIPFHGTGIFNLMVNALVQLGWEKNVTLRGAPYDWRKTPDTIGFNPRLKQLIEETVDAAEGQKITMISHSMGGNQIMYFLQNQPQEWNDKYIEQWISIGTPFGGVNTELQMFASGNIPYHLPMNPRSVRLSQRTWESDVWMLPTPEVFGDEPLLYSDSRNFTAHEHEDLMVHVGYTAGVKVHQRTKKLIDISKPPAGVKVQCMYSTGLDTPKYMDYRGKTFDQDPKQGYVDGDDTAVEESLAVCSEWAKTYPDQVFVKKYDKIMHKDMIRDKRPLGDVLQMVQDNSPKNIVV